MLRLPSPAWLRKQQPEATAQGNAESVLLQAFARAGAIGFVVSGPNMLSAILFAWKKSGVCHTLLSCGVLAGDAAQSKGKVAAGKQNALQAEGWCCSGGSGSNVGGPVFGTVCCSLE